MCVCGETETDAFVYVPGGSSMFVTRHSVLTAPSFYFHVPPHVLPPHLSIELARFPGDRDQDAEFGKWGADVHTEPPAHGRGEAGGQAEPSDHHGDAGEVCQLRQVEGTTMYPVRLFKKMVYSIYPVCHVW